MFRQLSADTDYIKVCRFSQINGGIANFHTVCRLDPDSGEIVGDLDEYISSVVQAVGSASSVYRNHVASSEMLRKSVWCQERRTGILAATGNAQRRFNLSAELAAAWRAAFVSTWI